MANRAEINRFGETLAKSVYSSVTISILTVGMLLTAPQLRLDAEEVAGVQMFMCFYGLSVFLQTPKERRQGRARFTIISFVIWILYTFMTGLEASTDFEVLFSSEPNGISYLNRHAEMWSNRLWWLGLHDLSLYFYIALGDGLMVRAPVSPPPDLC